MESQMISSKIDPKIYLVLRQVVYLDNLSFNNNQKVNHYSLVNHSKLDCFQDNQHLEIVQILLDKLKMF